MDTGITITHTVTAVMVTIIPAAAHILPPDLHQEEIMLIVHRQEVLPVVVMAVLSEVLPVATAEVQPPEMVQL
jgi:hypothetical protein